LDQYVPFLTEDELIKRGAHYKKADKAYDPYAIEDTVTGQNPASKFPVADLVLAQLQNA
jgi:hypothetical protein